jgi:hypothetical protein
VSEQETPDIVEVQVTRHDINLTFDDILKPLMQISPATVKSASGNAIDPNAAQHLKTLGDLATQMKDVVDRINGIDPSLLTAEVSGNLKPS